jgi:hypothetical protein
VTTITSPERLADRARDLEAAGLNGLRLVYVSLDAATPPAFAWLDVECHNANALAALPPPAAWRIDGGLRLRGGTAPGQVQVTQVLPDPDGRPHVLRLRVAPVGDYSTYTLRLQGQGLLPPDNTLPLATDPLFARLPFKFRPGCFNLDCSTPAASTPVLPAPTVDYLARDYDSFRHVLMTEMARRVPGWTPTSEADLDQVLIDLIAAQADEIADHHDRVIAERAITSARKRVSLARHGRLVDYHLHQGNQASTWVALTTAAASADLPSMVGGDDEWAVWNGAADAHWSDVDAVVFALPQGATRWRRRVYTQLNELQLYTWGDTVTALAAGATTADLMAAGDTSEAAAIALEDLLNGVSGLQNTTPAQADVATAVEHLLIEEVLNPATGQAAGRNRARRQRLRVLPGAQRLQDPVSGDWFVRVSWHADDALTQNYCFLCDCGGTLVRNLTLFHGNLMHVTQGRPRETRFLPPGTAPLPADDETPLRALSHARWQPRWRQHGPEQQANGHIATLPVRNGVLAWQATPADGITPPRSTLQVTLDGLPGLWRERTDLVDSRDDAEDFIVEAHENQTSTLRFGNGMNGRALPDDAVVIARWRSGQGQAGNVGADSLVHASSGALRVWNPFDVTDGREPEPAADLLRRAPEAYRRQQLRAVTLDDYATRAETVPGVAHARARYAWSGSWRVVRVALDLVGGGPLTAALRARVAAALDAVRLIGDDLELREAALVPLDIRLTLCAQHGYWVEDLRGELDAAFSDQPGGLFDPDAWTFGQALHASQLIGRALQVTGVERVVKLSMRRFNPGSGGGTTVVEIDLDDLPESTAQRLDIGDFEILVVANDPDQLERGRIGFEILGGRR